MLEFKCLYPVITVHRTDGQDETALNIFWEESFQHFHGFDVSDSPGNIHLKNNKHVLLFFKFMLIYFPVNHITKSLE